MAGGKRIGAGGPRKKKGEHKVQYGIRLAPDIVGWLRTLRRGEPIKIIETHLRGEMEKHETESF